MPRCFVVRPANVVGPFDYTVRLSGGSGASGKAAKHSPSASIQLIDVRDLAEWLVYLVERRVGRTCHAADSGMPLTFEDMLDQIASVTGPQRLRLNWVPRAGITHS